VAQAALAKPLRRNSRAQAPRSGSPTSTSPLPKPSRPNFLSARALHLDVTNPASIASALGQLEFLDILVNNAGIGHVGSIETTEPQDFDRLINVNVRSVYLVTRAFLPLLLSAHERHEALGAIVNVASVSGLVGIKQRFAYCTSKGAIVAMTRQLAVEYPKTLRVNAVCPGTVQTPFVEAYLESPTSTTKRRCARSFAPASPLAALAAPKKSPPPFDISPQTKQPSSPARCSPSMAAGPPHEPGAPRIRISLSEVI
jgi:NAD(P)-dependent dehydrogenase (short-subunit alcohol dehydrogenase family)